MSDLTLGSRVRGLVGQKTATALEKAFDVGTVEGLLRVYPRRYVSHGELTDLASLRPGDQATVIGRVTRVNHRQVQPRGSGRRTTLTEVTITDGSGASLQLSFFGRGGWAALKVGTEAMFAGTVNVYRRDLQLLHPEFAVGSVDDDSTSGLRRPVLPIYPATRGMPSWTTQTSVELVLDQLGEVEDTLPADLRERLGLVGLRAAFEGIHRPETAEDLERARTRLRFEEAYVTQVVLARRRQADERAVAVARAAVPGGLRERFVERLPFTLTDGQQRLVAELGGELAREQPMHRLLQGEVGSGKTVVALVAMLQVVDAGGQAALLAPTEVLAQQHHRSITAMLGPLAAGGMLGGEDGATRVALLTGSATAAARRATLLDVASGAAGLVVGTHALLQDTVSFAELGLVVVDEQHRFGVEQRAALVEKAERTPHVLVMTATPIPRTIAMTTFGDLETSVLRELPAGRQAVQTTVVAVREHPAWIDRVWQRVREEVAEGRRAYVVCSRIGADDPVAALLAEDGAPEPGSDGEEGPPPVAVLDLADELRAGPLADLQVEVLHGRMAPEAKDRAMESFATGTTPVLVATTVVEVGVDVREASVMVVMDADRFGVSQLHQLRGRVGRGTDPGLCLLVTAAEDGTPARERLDAVASTTDGFELSRRDLELRKEGDVLGAAQSGRGTFRLLSVVRHEDVIARARDEAVATVRVDPSLTGTPGLLTAVLDLEATERADFVERS